MVQKLNFWIQTKLLNSSVDRELKPWQMKNAI